MALYPPSDDTLYVFAIKTTQYAGNFEREMCGFCTGAVGDCGVGRKGAAEFREWVQETKPAFYLDYLADRGDDFDEDDFKYFCLTWDDDGIRTINDRGCDRPVTMGRNASQQWHDVWIFFGRRPTDAEIAVMKERAMLFAPRVKADILGFEILTYKTTVTREVETV